LLTMPVEWELVQQGYVPLELALGGLRGGHSGSDINDRRGNAVKLLARALLAITKSNDVALSGIAGGGRLNAIPREASAVLFIRGERLKAFRDIIDTLNARFKDEQGHREPDLRLQVMKPGSHSDGKVFNRKSRDTILNLLQALPHGVIAMSDEIPGLVETSTNVAFVRTDKDAVVVGTSQRSSRKPSLENMVATVSGIGHLAGARVEHMNAYPGWNPDLKSPCLGTIRKSYLDLFGKEPDVRVIHAGLECGLIAERFAGIDMVSFGPTIEGAHTPEERVNIATVQKFWDLLTATLRNLS